MTSAGCVGKIPIWKSGDGQQCDERISAGQVCTWICNFHLIEQCIMWFVAFVLNAGLEHVMEDFLKSHGIGKRSDFF